MLSLHMQEFDFIGKPCDKDIEAASGMEAPWIVEPNFKTTVDDTEWRG